MTLLTNVLSNLTWLLTTKTGLTALAVVSVSSVVIVRSINRMLTTPGSEEDKNFLDLQYLNTVPNPVGHDRPSDVVDNPPFPQEIEAKSNKELTKLYKIPIMRLVRESSLTEKEVNGYLLPIIERLMHIVHLLPASKEDHHSYEGGLLAHSLETATNCVRAAQDHIFDENESPDERYHNRSRWILACAIAGLAHDLGKVIRDIRVVDVATHTQKRMDVPMKNWIDRYGVKSYTISWVGENRTPKSHQGDSHFMLRSLIDDSVVNFLCYGNSPKIYQALRDAVYDMNPASPVGKILMTADMRSVSDDLIHMAQISAESMIVQTLSGRMIVKAIQRLVQKGVWEENIRRGNIFITSEGAFLRWEKDTMPDKNQKANLVAAEIAKSMRELANEAHQDNMPIPTADVMFEQMLHAAVLLPQEKTGSYFYSMLALPNRDHYIRCVRFRNPGLLVGDKVYSLVDAHIKGREATIRQKERWLREYNRIPETFNFGEEQVVDGKKANEWIETGLKMLPLDDRNKVLSDILNLIAEHTLKHHTEAVADEETGEISYFTVIDRPGEEAAPEKIPDSDGGEASKATPSPDAVKLPDLQTGFQPNFSFAKKEEKPAGSRKEERKKDTSGEPSAGKNPVPAKAGKNAKGDKGLRRVVQTMSVEAAEEEKPVERTPAKEISDEKKAQARAMLLEGKKKSAALLESFQRNEESGAAAGQKTGGESRPSGDAWTFVRDFISQLKAGEGELLNPAELTDEGEPLEERSLKTFLAKADRNNISRAKLEALFDEAGEEVEVNWTTGKVRLRK